MTLDLYGPHKDVLGDYDEHCEALGDQNSCDADDICSWCKSAAVKSACKSTATAKSLPSAVFQCDNLTLKDDQEDCEKNADQDTCDKVDKCSWCKSAAVKSKCNSLDTAKTLPAAVFQCDKLSEDAIFLN